MYWIWYNKKVSIINYLGQYDAACEEGPGLFAHLLTFLSLILILITLPFSLMWVVKVVQVNFSKFVFSLDRR